MIRLEGTQHDIILGVDLDWFVLPPGMPFRDQEGYNWVGWFMGDTLEWWQNPGKPRVDDHHVVELRNLTKLFRTDSLQTQPDERSTT